MAKDIYEVQTRFIYGWENVWSIEEEDEQGHVTCLQLFDTHDEAMAAIYEFFADLHRAGIAQLYQMEDYRVRQIR